MPRRAAVLCVVLTALVVLGTEVAHPAQSGADGSLFCLSLTDGEQVFCESLGHVPRGPVAAAGLVVYWDEQKVTAFDPSTKKVAWSMASPRTDALLAAGRDLYVTGDGRLLKLNAATGAKAWEAGPGARLRPAVGRDTVACYTKAEVVVLDRQSGKLRWRQPAPGLANVFGPPGLTESAVYYPSGDSLLAAGIQDGQKLWSFACGYAAGTPLCAGEVVYTCSADGVLHALGAGSGKELWHLKTVGLSDPVLARGRLYGIGVQESGLWVVDLASGKLAWQWKNVPGPGSLEVSDGTVVLTTVDQVVALDAASGLQRWGQRLRGCRQVVLEGDKAYVTVVKRP